MTDARERLERAVFDALVLGDGRSHFDPDSRLVLDGFGLVQRIADAVERALAPEPPAPLKVWPGLEEAERLYVARYNTPANTTHQGARLAGLAAAAPHLWRALVASLPQAHGCVDGWVTVGVRYTAVPRAALAALADPYDGGVK